MIKRSWGVVAGAAALALSLGGCVVDTSPTASPAATGGQGTAALSGKLTVACGAMEEVCDAWTKAFTAKTGVQTSFVRLSSGETVARLAASKAAPEFDVWHGGPADGYGAAAGQDLLEKYTPRTPRRSPTSTRTPTASGTASTSAPWGSAPTPRC
ncbi:hypothetical protein [Propioniciclava coleopterorum]|uniref:hypothetical protein n=1 Tax=Propioniciclava coleopterorum TaxID=2714937 RepID=UPI001FE90AD3|nr:hypothetical protein [Propioniciclava coleopterorum]